MMNGEFTILAIETSTSLMGAAVTVGEEVLSEGFVDKPKVHSYRLLPMCDRVLSEAKVSPSQLGAVAVSVGPGSFTGLRIGCATAQGLSHAWGKRVVPVPTFSVLVEQAIRENRERDHEFHVAAVQGRAKAQTVTALYSREGVQVIPPEGRSLERFALQVASAVSTPIIVVGDAAQLFAEHVAGADTGSLRDMEVSAVSEPARLPLPGMVGRLAARMMREGLSVEPKAAIPLYYRKHQAEVLLSQKKNEGRAE
jgi:tRNA threonylcarbamoyladenosine biosynthesis protein TsaB